MSYAQGTTHYNFPQIAGTDRPTFADANEAFRTLDTKLYALEGSATEVDGRLDTAEGNIVQLQGDVQTAQGTADLAKSTADTAVEQIGITNANVSQLTTRVGNKFDSVGIADPYDTSATYAVGDVVTYNGQRYRCTTAVTIAEPFDVTKWTGEDVETVLDEIKSDLANKEDKHNYVSVTANGIKNISTLLDELFALLDTTKITQLSTIETDRGFGHINGRSSGYVSFVTTYFDSYVGFQYAYLRASSSKLLRFRSSNSWTEEDISSEVPSSGVVFRVYY